jgi:hypothetical protein
MALVRIVFPPGVGPIVPRNANGSASNTTPVVPDSNSQALVDTSQVLLLDLLQHGCSIAPLSGSTAQRPTSGTHPGLRYFDSTIGKPIFRNAANSGWVDATGGAV